MEEGTFAFLHPNSYLFQYFEAFSVLGARVSDGSE